MAALQGDAVPVSDRLRCIDAMAVLFKDCFAARCSPHLGHLDEPGANPLNDICYMWWDILPLHGLEHHYPQRPDSAAIDRRILSVMAQGLSLNSDACLESSLHGLDHWRPYYGKEVKQIIDNFIKAKPRLRPELRTYALTARRGYVL